MSSKTTSSQQPMRDLRDTIEHAVDEAVHSDQGEEQEGRPKSGINIANRVNKAVKINVGGKGGASTATARQSVSIRQSDGETHEVVEETRTSD